MEKPRFILFPLLAACAAFGASCASTLHAAAGSVWFQGFNDMVDGQVYPRHKQPERYAMYSDLLATFIRDVRKDFNAPKMPFVIGVMGVGGLKDQ